MKKITILVSVVAIGAGTAWAGEKKAEREAALVSAAGPRVAAPVRPVGQGRISGQRLGPAGMYRGQVTLNRRYYSPAVGSPNQAWRTRVQPEGGLAVNVPSNTPRSRPTSDAADDILATIPRQRRGNGGRQAANGAVTETNAGTPVADGAVSSGAGTTQNSPNANTPVANLNPNRRRGHEGQSVVQFNNNGNVSFGDAEGRCHDWKRRGGDRNWWNRHCPVVILIGGGYWGWNDGWWYPAWGYSGTYVSYGYDGPIYGYDGLPPDQVVANVQGALQEMGYFQFAVDGVLGPATQAAIADFQRDNGLFVTGAIDRSTLVALGFIL